jgi:RNA polymerase sigma factor (sigma-70 family)
MLVRARRFSDSRRDAEEAVQETFARFIERANPTIIRNPPAYLTRTLDNVIRARRRGDQFEFPVDPSDSCLTLRFQTFDLERSEARQDIRAALERLKPRHRRALALLSEGVPPREIGPMLGVNGQAARALLKRARSNARRLLRDGYFSVVMPRWLFRISARLQGLLAQLDLGFESAVVGILAVGMTVSAVPSNRGAFYAHPVRGESSALPGALIISLSPSRTSSTPASEQSERSATLSAKTRSSQLVARAEAPDTTSDLSHHENTGDPEPGLVDQLVQLLENPSSLPTPECSGIVSCPASH